MTEGGATASTGAPIDAGTSGEAEVLPLASPDDPPAPDADAATLRALVEAQRAELERQHEQLGAARAQLREQTALAAQLPALQKERDSYLEGMLQATRRATASEEARAAERKGDKELYAANLQRLLEEKAQRMEEIEVLQAQKDRSMEQLVTASRQSGFEQQLRDELELWKGNHRATTEELQAADAERQRLADALRVEEEARIAAAARAEGLVAQLADLTLQLRHAAERHAAATRSADEHAATAAVRGAEGTALAAALRDVDDDELSARVAPALDALRAELAAERVAVRCCALSLAESDRESGASAAEGRRCAALAAKREDEAAAARGELERERRRAAADHAEATAAAARLGAEGDTARAELAAQRKLADSLKLELKKALARSCAG